MEASGERSSSSHGGPRVCSLRRSRAGGRRRCRRIRRFPGTAGGRAAGRTGRKQREPGKSSGKAGKSRRGEGAAGARRSPAQPVLSLSSLSQQTAAGGDTEAAILLALEALPKDLTSPERPFLVEAEAALYQALLQDKNVMVFRHDAGVTDAAFDPQRRSHCYRIIRQDRAHLERRGWLGGYRLERSSRRA